MLGSLPFPGGEHGQATFVASMQFRLSRRARMSLDLAGYLSPWPKVSLVFKIRRCPRQTHSSIFKTEHRRSNSAPPEVYLDAGIATAQWGGGIGICRGGGGRRLGGSEGEGGDDMQDSESPSQGKAGQEERRRSGHARGSTPSGRRTVAPVVEARLHALRRERGRRRHASRRPARKAARQAEATCDAGAVPLR